MGPGKGALDKTFARLAGREPKHCPNPNTPTSLASTWVMDAYPGVAARTHSGCSATRGIDGSSGHAPKPWRRSHKARQHGSVVMGRRGAELSSFTGTTGPAFFRSTDQVGSTSDESSSPAGSMGSSSDSRRLSSGASSSATDAGWSPTIVGCGASVTTSPTGRRTSSDSIATPWMRSGYLGRDHVTSKSPCIGRTLFGHLTPSSDRSDKQTGGSCLTHDARMRCMHNRRARLRKILDLGSWKPRADRGMNSGGRIGRRPPRSRPSWSWSSCFSSRPGCAG